MDQAILKDKTYKHERTIIIFSLVSLIAASVGVLRSFISYSYSGGQTKPSFYAPDVATLLLILIGLVPDLLMVIYALKRRSQSTKVLLPIILGVVAISSLTGVFFNWVSLNLIRGISYTPTIEEILYPLVIAVPFGLAAVFSLQKGLKKAAFIIAAAACGLAMQLLSIVSIFQNIEMLVKYKFYFSLVMQVNSIVGAIFFYMALLLIGLNSSTT